MKIFLIEDDLKLIKYIKEYLTAYDYEVFTIDNFDHVEEIDPQLIILDIN